MKRVFSMKRREGFSLIELMIGLVLLAIALASAFELNYQLSMITQRNQNLGAAVNLAEAKLEELRNANWAEIVNGADEGTIDAAGNPDGIFSRAWVVANDTPLTGLKKITVTVSWTQSGGDQEYELVGVAEP